MCAPSLYSQSLVVCTLLGECPRRVRPSERSFYCGASLRTPVLRGCRLLFTWCRVAPSLVSNCLQGECLFVQSANREVLPRAGSGMTFLIVGVRRCCLLWPRLRPSSYLLTDAPAALRSSSFFAAFIWVDGTGGPCSISVCIAP